MPALRNCIILIIVITARDVPPTRRISFKKVDRANDARLVFEVDSTVVRVRYVRVRR